MSHEQGFQTRIFFPVKFAEMDLHPSLMKGIQSQNYVDCTPIQALSFPVIVEGKDVAGLAQTGTGKTAAFILPLMERILRARKHSTQSPTRDLQNLPTQSTNQDPLPVVESVAESDKRAFTHWKKQNYILVLVPTRELAEQVFETVRIFGEAAQLRGTAIYGGMAYEQQKKAINQGVEFIVATPGRLIDLYKEHVVDLKQVRAVVFDEADRMFDMGFKEDMKFILHRIPRDRQFLVYSATLNFDVLNVCYEFGSEPVEINVSKDQPKAENVDDLIYHLGSSEKPGYLLSLLKREAPKQAIVFSNFKHNVERIALFLIKNNFPAVGISSLMTQMQRNRVMAQFKNDKENNILVATDLAARGLDVVGVDLVINFDLPDDPENYVHRIGRTGRAGAKGKAFSLVADRDLDALKRIEDYLDHKVEMGWLDDTNLLKDFVSFPQESELSGYPVRVARSEKPRSGFRGNSFHKNKKGPHSRRSSAPGDSRVSQKYKKGERTKEYGNGNPPSQGMSKTSGVQGEQRNAKHFHSEKSSQKRAKSSHVRHHGKHLNHQRHLSKGSTDLDKRSASQVKHKSLPKVNSGSSRSSSSSLVAKQSLGKKVSAFFKKIFRSS